MYTLGVLFVLEIVLRVFSSPAVMAELGGAPGAVAVLALGLGAVMAAYVDVQHGFYSRLAYALGCLWYIASLYRLLPLVDAFGTFPLLMGLVWLVFMPLLMLGLPAMQPTYRAIRQLRGEQ